MSLCLNAFLNHEKSKKTYHSSFESGTGHYTAMVWGHTDRIGCGSTVYRDGRWGQWHKFLALSYFWSNEFSLAKVNNPLCFQNTKTFTFSWFPNIMQISRLKCIVDHTCVNGSGFTHTYLVCNYGRAGNVISTPMYTSGPACSACPQGSSCTSQGLCR